MARKKNNQIDWTHDNYSMVKHLGRMLVTGMSYPEVARRLSIAHGEDINQDKVQHVVRRYRHLGFFIPKETEIPYFTDERIPMGDWAICCDVHAPYHNELWCNRFVMVSQVLGINKAVIVGDLLDMDFAKKWFDVEPSTLDREEMLSDPVFKLLNYFKSVVLIMGNHEKRPELSTDARIQAKHLFRIFGKDIWREKFKLIPRTRVWIGNTYLCVHPRNYSQISAAVALRLAEKHNCHVLNAHGHFVALRYDRSGEYMGVDLGGLFDINKTKYIHEQTTTHPVWNNGFGMIKNKKFHLFHENTDWAEWEKQWEVLNEQTRVT